jgi:hypothetical protein
MFESPTHSLGDPRLAWVLLTSSQVIPDWRGVRARGTDWRRVRLLGLVFPAKGQRLSANGCFLKDPAHSVLSYPSEVPTKIQSRNSTS